MAHAGWAAQSPQFIFLTLILFSDTSVRFQLTYLLHGIVSRSHHWVIVLFDFVYNVLVIWPATGSLLSPSIGLQKLHMYRLHWIHSRVSVFRSNLVVTRVGPVLSQLDTENMFCNSGLTYANSPTLPDAYHCT